MIYRVITFNMCHGDNNNGIIDVVKQANVIKSYNPDVILLQEVDVCTSRSGYINQLDEFKTNVGMDYSCFGSNIPFKEGWYGNAILSKYPILSSENYLNSATSHSKESKAVLYVEINLEGRKINVFNTHMPVAEKDRISLTESVLKMMTRNNISGDMILGGDFNFGIIPLGNHQYEFEKQDIYKEYENIKKLFTCPDFDKNTWPTEKPIADIDKIMYTGNIKLLKIERLDVEISDHYPVYAEFELL